MIQDFLTYASEFVLVGSIALYGSLFIHGLMARRRVSPGQLELDFSAVLTDEEVEELQQEPIAPAKPVVLDVVVPFKRPAPKLPDLSGMSIRQLKAIASRAKLPKYNNCTKVQLAARLLAEVERDRLVTALAS